MRVRVRRWPTGLLGLWLGALFPSSARAEVTGDGREDTAPGEATPAKEPRLRPLYPASEEFSARRPRTPFRGLTLGLSGQLVLGRVLPMNEGMSAHYSLQGTPVLDLLTEFGHRNFRFVIGPYIAPVYMGFSDYFVATFFGMRAGFLAGGERFRGGIIGGGGLIGWEVMAHAFITPWRDRHGGRHGIAVSAGAWLTRYPSIALGYRFAPAALNHVGGRWEGMKRARAHP